MTPGAQPTLRETVLRWMLGKGVTVVYLGGIADPAAERVTWGRKVSHRAIRVKFGTSHPDSPDPFAVLRGLEADGLADHNGRGRSAGWWLTAAGVEAARRLIHNPPGETP